MYSQWINHIDCNICFMYLKTRPGDLVMSDPFEQLFIQNVDYFTPYSVIYNISFLICVDLFRPFWISLHLFGPLLTHLDQFGPLWTHLTHQELIVLFGPI